jgi:hypothetical protein
VADATAREPSGVSPMRDVECVLSVAGLLAQTIENVFADRSVSLLFAGLNELF